MQSLAQVHLPMNPSLTSLTPLFQLLTIFRTPGLAVFSIHLKVPELILLTCLFEGLFISSLHQHSKRTGSILAVLYIALSSKQLQTHAALVNISAWLVGSPFFFLLYWPVCQCHRKWQKKLSCLHLLCLDEFCKFPGVSVELHFWASLCKKGICCEERWTLMALKSLCLFV